ncbi:hypothetical protein HW132_14420 [Brasilonema sp. CT11]|nr:hypothetical protein [Brasilonema sp. CT11]
MNYPTPMYAVHADKTLTQVLEELIDSLPNTENGNSSSTNVADRTPFNAVRRSIRHYPELIPTLNGVPLQCGASSAFS